MKYDLPGNEEEVLPNILGLTDKRAVELAEAEGFLNAELVLYSELNDDTVIDVAQSCDRTFGHSVTFMILRASGVR